MSIRRSDEARYALALLNAGRFAKSIESAKKILKKHKNNPEALHILSQGHFGLGEFLAALHYAEVLAKIDKSPAAFYHHGTTCLKLGYMQEAVKSLSEANKHNHPRAYADLAFSLRLVGDYEQSRKVVEDRIKQEPENHAVYVSLGQHYREMRDLERSIDCCRKSLAIKESNEALLDLSMSCIMADQWEEGWRLFENRWRVIPQAKAAFSKVGTFWNGEDLTGKHLVLFCEQGFGDTFQFLMYIPLLKSLYKNLKVSVFLKYEHLSLEPLLIRLLPDDIEIHHNTLMVGKIDYICSFLSLPFILGQKSFKDVPPLMDLNEIEPRHLPSEKFKIGLAYFGDRTHPHDHFRSMPIKNFEILQQVEGVELYDLTIDHKPRMTIGKGQVKLYEGLNVIRKEISDWEDTASLIEAMDLIVCVDTGVCHLAGVMKKKAFLLLPYSPDWRWGLEDKNWWYKDMPIFRQSKFNDWSEALQRLNFVVLEEVKKIFIERINKYYDDR